MRMTIPTEQGVIKTYPVKINFDWLENTGESFEADSTILIESKVLLIKGSGAILGKRLFAQTTYNKLELFKVTKGFIREIFKTKVKRENKVFILTDIWSTGPYHFYVDILSKVVELKNQLDLNQEGIKFVVFDDPFTDKVIIPLF